MLPLANLVSGALHLVGENLIGSLAQIFQGG
jgi:hypothetical protein